MEALQNGKEPSELAKRFPPLQVARLAALHDVAVDTAHRDFIKAQMLVREILVRLKEGEGDGPAGSSEIVLLHGDIGHVQLPGAQSEGTASGEPRNGSAPTGAGKKGGSG